MSALEDKKDRVRLANQVIRAIGLHAQKHFLNAAKRRFAGFGLGDDGSVWFADKTSGASFQPREDEAWPGFTETKACRLIVLDLADYILTGEPLSRRDRLWLQLAGAAGCLTLPCFAKEEVAA